MALDLAYSQAGAGEPLIILHGLFGSGRNWAGHAKRLAQGFQVITVDLRNHGDSPWDASMSYEDMADDLALLMEKLGLEHAGVIGHSMGGKAAMALALRKPDCVDRLAVVDIAPVVYPPRLLPYAEALARIRLDKLSGRGEADRILAPVVGDAAVRAFLLQNLKREAGRFSWRLNVEAIIREMEVIGGFPGELLKQRYEGPTLFIAGGHSDHLLEEHQPRIRQLFPAARAHVVSSAGHWVHSEQPEAFLRALSGFLSSR